MCLGMFGFEGFFDVGSLGIFSKMTTMKVLEGFGDVRCFVW